METKRLFIGGLYKDIKEADLRDRFKTFGTITSVEIIRRTDDEGYTMKTFAYLDILQTESDFKKCVSLLSNSKWKGCCLKIQAAKESFLTRLTRERQQHEQLNMEKDTNKTETKLKEKTKPQHAIPQTLPKAVPGTSLPGKKNWVVGKFGRVLPVMYLRRRDRKKLAKFDPSKTTHCLKRINLDDSTRTLSDLTWNLDTEMEMSNLVSLKNTRKPKLSENGVDTFAFRESAVEKQAKKSNERTLKNYAKNSSALNLVENNSSDFNSEFSDLNPDSDSSHHSYTEVNKNSSDNTDAARADMSVISESSCAVSPSHHDIEISARTSSKKNSDSIQLDAKSPSSSSVITDLRKLKSPSASKMPKSMNSFRDQFAQNDDKLQVVVDDKDISVETSSTASESSDEISDSGLNESEGESIFSKNSDTVSSRNRYKKRTSNLHPGPDDKRQSLRMHSEERSPKTLKAKINSMALENTMKKKLSNDKRLDALLEKRKSVTAQKSAIKEALKDLDSGVQSGDGAKHIVFGDDEEEEDGKSEGVSEKPAYSVGEKISGSKARSWLGLDSDSDEGNDLMADGRDDEKPQLLTLKPHFEGKAGEELFKLQRSFGGDKRFDLDSRFRESEEVDEDEDHMPKEEILDGNEPSSTREEDDISGNLKQEKEMSLKILSSILGGDFRAEFGQGENQEKAAEFRSSVAVHYDPTREDHKQFEQTDTEEKDKEHHNVTVVKEVAPDDPVLPEVSGDKYYDVNTSLAELFGSKDQGPSAFTFLSQEPEVDSDNEEGTAAKDSHIGSTEEIRQNPWQRTTKLPYDSSDDSDSEDGDDVVVDDAVNDGDHNAKSSSQLDELFFFHPDCSELTNRINDGGEPFMRAGSQDGVHKYWVSVRSELTQDYKRKRKDAVRRQNKLAAKRFRHR